MRYGENPHQAAAFYRERQPAAIHIATEGPLGLAARSFCFNAEAVALLHTLGVAQRVIAQVQAFPQQQTLSEAEVRLKHLLELRAIGLITEHYTSDERKPARGISKASETGSATNIIAGLGVGMMSTALPIIVLAIAIPAAFLVSGLAGILIERTVKTPTGRAPWGARRYKVMVAHVRCKPRSIPAIGGQATIAEAAFFVTWSLCR